MEKLFTTPFEDDDDYPNIPIKTLIDQIREAVDQVFEEKFKKYLIETGLLSSTDNISNNTKLVSLSELCLQLDISRTTISKWRKDSILGPLIAQYTQTIGSRKRYDIEGIKRLLLTNDFRFGKGKEYKYRVALKANIFRMKKMIVFINKKILSKESLSAEDDTFLQQNSFKIGTARDGTKYLLS